MCVMKSGPRKVVWVLMESHKSTGLHTFVPNQLSSACNVIATGNPMLSQIKNKMRHHFSTYPQFPSWSSDRYILARFSLLWTHCTDYITSFSYYTLFHDSNNIQWRCFTWISLIFQVESTYWQASMRYNSSTLTYSRPHPAWSFSRIMLWIQTPLVFVNKVDHG